MTGKKPAYNDSVIVQLERKYVDEPHEATMDGYVEVLNEAARSIVQLKRAVNPAITSSERQSEIRVGALSWQEYIFFNRTGSGIDILDWQPSSPVQYDDTDGCGCSAPRSPQLARGKSSRALVSAASRRSLVSAASNRSRRSSCTPQPSRRYRTSLGSTRSRGVSVSGGVGSDAAGGGSRSEAASPVRAAEQEPGRQAGSAEARPASPAVAPAAAAPRAPMAPSGRLSTPLRQCRGRHLHEQHTAGQREAGQRAPHPQPPATQRQPQQGQQGPLATGTHCTRERPEQVRFSAGGAAAAGPAAAPHGEAREASGEGSSDSRVAEQGGGESVPGTGLTTAWDASTGSEPAETEALAPGSGIGGGSPGPMRSRASTGGGGDAEATPWRRSAQGTQVGGSRRGSGDGSGAAEAEAAAEPPPTVQHKKSLADEAIREFARTAYEPGEGRQSLLLGLLRDDRDAPVASPRLLLPTNAHGQGHGQGLRHGQGHCEADAGPALAPVPRSVPRHVTEALSALLASSGRGPATRACTPAAGRASPAPYISIFADHAGDSNLPGLGLASTAGRGRCPSAAGSMRPRRATVAEGLRRSWQGPSRPQPPPASAAAAAPAAAGDRPLLAMHRGRLQSTGGGGGSSAGCSGSSSSAGSPARAGAQHGSPGSPCHTTMTIIGAGGEASRVSPSLARTDSPDVRKSTAWQSRRSSGCGGVDACVPGPPAAFSAAAPLSQHGGKRSECGSGHGPGCGDAGGSPSGGLIRGYVGGKNLDYRLLDSVPRLSLDAPRLRPQPAPTAAAPAARASCPGGGAGGRCSGGGSLHAGAAALAAAATADCHAEMRRGLLAAPPGLAGVLHGSRPSTAWGADGQAATQAGGSRSGGGAASPATGADGSTSPGRFARVRRISACAPAPLAENAAAATPAGGRGGSMLVTRAQLDGHAHPQRQQACGSHGGQGLQATTLGMRGCLKEDDSGGHGRGSHGGDGDGGGGSIH